MKINLECVDCSYSQDPKGPSLDTLRSRPRILNSSRCVSIHSFAKFRVTVTYLHRLNPFLLHQFVYMSELFSKFQFVAKSSHTSENGTSSAVGTAPRKSVRMGRSKLSLAQAMNLLRSVLLMPPIGFRSGNNSN